MGSEVTLFKCRKCGREFGFIEHFSHDHPDFINDKPDTDNTQLCPDCLKIVKESAGKGDGSK